MTIAAFYGEGTLSPTALPSIVKTIAGSNFNTVIFGLFHIGRPSIKGQLLGDLIFNNDIAATGGAMTTFVNPTPSINWAHSMQLLKASGRIDKIYLSFGGAGPVFGGPVVDFTTIANDIMKYNDNGVPYIPTTSDLYENLAAFREYFTMVDGVDIDQEETRDGASNAGAITDAMIAFGNMVIDVGFSEVTFAPPSDDSVVIYQNAAVAINNAVGRSVVSRLNLQNYGGVSNLSIWTAAAAAIGKAGNGTEPQLLAGADANGFDSDSIYNTFSSLRSPSYAGGFVWRYDFISCAPATYGTAVINGLNGGPKPTNAGPC